MPLVHSSLYRRPMNRMVVFLVAMWFISGTAFAQEEKKNTETTVSDKISWVVSSHVDGQKFEILARPHDSRLTYRINKETGEVWLLDGASSSLLDAENLDNALIVPDKTISNSYLFPQKLCTLCIYRQERCGI